MVKYRIFKCLSCFHRGEGEYGGQVCTFSIRASHERTHKNAKAYKTGGGLPISCPMDKCFSLAWEEVIVPEREEDKENG